MTVSRIARVAGFTLTALLLPTVAAAELEFTRFDLGPENTLLFEAEVRAPGYGSYSTLFEQRLPAALELSNAFDADASEMAPQLSRLTFFPEQLQVLRDPDRIQIRNRFGTVRSTAEPDRFRPVETLGRFPYDGEPLPAGMLRNEAYSPDGRYVVRLEPTSVGYGRLVLIEIASGERYEIAAGVERSTEEKPVTWSPRGDALVYARRGSVYLFSVRHYESGREFAEDYRRIGPGRLSSVRWSDDARLLYLSGTVVYRLRTESFFTRALYQSYLTIGDAIGRLPQRFDPAFERFWVSPDTREIMVGRDGSSLSLHSLDDRRERSRYTEGDAGAAAGDDRSAGARTGASNGSAMPHLELPRDGRVQRVLWGSNGRATVLVSRGSGETGEQNAAERSGRPPERPSERRPERRLYRLDEYDAGEDRRFHNEAVAGVRDAALSPDGKTIALISGRALSVRDHRDWSLLTRFTHYDPLHLSWIDDNRVVVAGRYLTEKFRLEEGEQRFLAFSQAQRFGYELDREHNLLVQSRYALRRLEPRDSEGRAVVASEAADRFAVRAARSADERVRVFTERFKAGRYRNRLMARQLSSLRTREVVPLPKPHYEPFPEQEEPVSLTNFTHGSRLRAREVAFVFNAVESSIGLERVLETLGEHDITATFFVNGDFMRREPHATRTIAASGHEVGSLFYTHFDFSRSRFDIDAEFVQRGLARTEDHYYSLTGRELAPLWHAPYYFSNATIVAAGADIGYTYVGRDVDSLDWVPARSASGIPRLYRRSAELVDRVVDRKKPGSIIAMTIGSPDEGKPYGGREDYVFQYLDVLIEALIERGYRVVPVSVLIERAR